MVLFSIKFSINFAIENRFIGARMDNFGSGPHSDDRADVKTGLTVYLTELEHHYLLM
jgi:hypothetical protein